MSGTVSLSTFSPQTVDINVLRAQLALARQQRVERAKNDIRFFADYYFADQRTEPSPSWHYELLELASSKRDKRWKNAAGLVVAIPRGHSKSTLISLITALWWGITQKKHFILIVSDTDTQARSFTRDIKAEIESNERIRADFGELSGEKFGLKWTEEQFVIIHRDINGKMGWMCKYMARSTGSKMRGLKNRGSRPDAIVCHEEGTPILHEGKWIPVEDHPTAKMAIEDGYEIRVWGLPFSEVVTYKHRFWTKKIKSKVSSVDAIVEEDADWCEAQNLAPDGNQNRRASYLGYPIDMTIGDIQPITYYKPSISFDRDSLGRFYNTKNGHEQRVPIEFFDTEWWWLFGLWWGDGHTAKINVGITVADTQPEIKNRITDLLDRYKICWHIIPRSGCSQVIFSHAAIARWLHSWRIGNSQKQPPAWVENIDLHYQTSLVKGYIDSDGHITKSGVHVTSIHVPGLLSLRRILSRLGIAASIRTGRKGKVHSICGIQCHSRDTFDLRFQNGASILGYDIPNQTRYGVQRTFIKDGFLWSKVRSIEEVKERVFVPIKTETHCYNTAFGMHHNCDDIENDELVQTAEQRQKTWDWFTKAVIPALDPRDGTLIVVGTILHFESLLAKLLERKRMDGKTNMYITIKLRAIQDNGEPLWPTRFPLAKLQELREQIGSLAFRSEYMNDPIDDETRRFRPEWVQWWNKNELTWDKNGKKCFWRDKPLRIYMGVDPAIQEKETSDYFSTVVIGVAPGPTYLLLAVTMDRLDFPHQVEHIIQECDFWHPEVVAIETNAYQKSLPQTLLRQQKIPIREVNHSGDKIARITSMSIWWERGDVLLRAANDGEPGEADELDRVQVHRSQYAFYLQAMRFPNAGHDDGLDAMESAMSAIGSGKKLFTPGSLLELGRNN